MIVFASVLALIATVACIVYAILSMDRVEREAEEAARQRFHDRTRNPFDDK